MHDGRRSASSSAPELSMSNPFKRVRSALYNRIRLLSFRLGVDGLIPGTYRAYIPDRYWAHTKNPGPTPVPPVGTMRAFLSGNGMNNRGDMPRYYFLVLVCEQVVKEGIRGDVAELGVYKGNTAVLLAGIARHFGTTAYLFDTYGGFAKEDLVGIDADKDATAQFDDTSLQAVRALVGEANTRFVQGRFPESIAQVPSDARYSVVHIDCDLYAPFVAALEYFYPRLVTGGFLIMHDYSSRSWQGAEAAVDQFFAGKPEKIIPVPDKSGSAVVRKM